jgi:hypothetical protein
VDEAISQYQHRLDAAGEKIGQLGEHGHAEVAARLRSLHQRLTSAFAGLRKAYGDDWHSMEADAEAGWRELRDELGAADSLFIGWHDEEVEALDQSLDEVTRELEQLHADDVASRERRRAMDQAGLAELQAQVDDAKQRRKKLGPDSNREAVASYSAAVKEAVEKLRKLKR